MRTDWLTAGLVEEIHRTLLQGRSVDAVVAGLEGATLSGLLEYGCLRWSLRDGGVPPLPDAVVASALGRSLVAVRSDLGLRTDGPPRRTLRRLDPQPSEFHVIRYEGDLLSEEWDHFVGRFEASVRQAGFSFDAAARMQLALYAMAENVVLHSRTPVPALVGYLASPGRALFCVSDVGVGVLASLRSNPAFRHLRRHADAIRTALQDGATSLTADQGGGGFGFRDVFNSLADQWGSLRFRSGEGCVTMEGTDCDATRGGVSYPPPLPGFQVSVCCRTDAPDPHDERDDPSL